MNNKNEIVIYTANSQLKAPILLLKNMFADILASRFVAYRLFKRDIKAKYRQTLLGYIWAFVPSIVVAYGLVAANSANIINIGKTDLPFPAYVMLSMVLWQTFLEAFNAPLDAITKSKTLLAKINFPRESIVLAKVGEVLFNFSIKLILIALLYFLFDMPITWKAVFAFLGVLQLIVLGLFLGLIIAPIGGVYLDVSRAISVITTVWFFITPVIYPVPITGKFALVVSLNPVTPILVATREMATTGVMTNYSSYILVSFISFIGLLISWIIFRLSIPYVIERMPS